MPSKYKFPDDLVVEAVASTENITQALRALGYHIQGANPKKLKARIKELGLDTSHFKGQGSNKGKMLPPRHLDIDKVLCEKSPYTNTNSLKRRLIKLGILENKCRACSLSNWLGKPISLHIDHINGNNSDNRRENLQLLCPNCHSQTTTYCGRNKNKNYTKCS